MKKPSYSRSKINNKDQEKSRLATGDTGTEPIGKELHADALKRVTTHHAAVDETDGQRFSPGTLTWRRYPQRRPQKGHDTRRHRRRRRHNAELSSGKTFTHAHRLPAISKRDPQHMI
jgi:hypothetical protein